MTSGTNLSLTFFAVTLFFVLFWGCIYGIAVKKKQTHTHTHTRKVSVLVASGDDGAGQSATCPVDPRLPSDVSGGAVEGTETSCPFDDKEDCNCASFSIELKR